MFQDKGATSETSQKEVETPHEEGEDDRVLFVCNYVLDFLVVIIFIVVITIVITVVVVSVDFIYGGWRVLL